MFIVTVFTNSGKHHSYRTVQATRKVNKPIGYDSS